MRPVCPCCGSIAVKVWKNEMSCDNDRCSDYLVRKRKALFRQRAGNDIDSGKYDYVPGGRWARPVRYGER